MNDAVRYLLEIVEGLQAKISEGASPLSVLQAIAPLIAGLAQTSPILNDRLRTRIQRDAHHALRSAGLIATEDLP